MRVCDSSGCVDDVFDSSVSETSDPAKSGGEFSVCDRSILETNVQKARLTRTVFVTATLACLVFIAAPSESDCMQQ